MTKVFLRKLLFNITMPKMTLDASTFFSLEKQLIESGMDADLDSFATIRKRLSTKTPILADEFARQAIYVVLAGGFSQRTAKKIHARIMEILKGPFRVATTAQADSCATADACLCEDDEFSARLYETLLSIFNNRNKISAIVKLWKNRKTYRDDYYALPGNLDAKLSYIATLPHIGKITANHLARNLGENIVKYDIWIQRLAAKETPDENLIDNGNLHPRIKESCDEMFAKLERSTGLPRGYIDVVLWKSCQNGLIKA
jgi:hypothetical protein